MTTTTDAETTTTTAGPIGAERKPQRKTARRGPLGRAPVIAIQLALLVLWLWLWETSSNMGWVNPSFSGSPSGVWEQLVELIASGTLWAQLVATFSATFIAFVIGTVTGTLAGLILGLSPTMDKIASPFLVPLNSIPRIALAPLFIVWFGLTMQAKVWLAVSIVFFVLLFNARAAVKTVDPDLMMLGKTLGYGKARTLRKIVAPSAVPGIFAGVRLSITYSLLGVIASEMIAASDGLGQNIVYFSSTFQIDGVFAILLVLALTATAVNFLVELFERWLLRWQRP